jgi:deoxyribonuclease V
METGRRPDCGVCAAVDVHYLRTGGARAAAVLAADAAFAQVLAERTAVMPRVQPYRPGEFYLRELPPLRAVLDDLSELGLLVVDGYADLDPAGRPGRAPRPGRACARRVRHPGDRGGQVPVPHRYPRGAGPARILGTPAVRHRRRDARAEPADVVRRMTGRYRLPDALRRADTLARTSPAATTMTDGQPD